jgi:hypothetical protein
VYRLLHFIGLPMLWYSFKSLSSIIEIYLYNNKPTKQLE